MDNATFKQLVSDKADELMIDLGRASDIVANELKESFSDTAHIDELLNHYTERLSW